MEITRRTDYAIRLIAALVASDGEPLSVRTAAEDYEVPYSFARSIQHDLVIAGIISSVRGASGGMVLNVDPAKLTMLDVVESVQGPVGVAVCSREANWCPREAFCQFHSVWLGADALIRDYLASVSIKDVVDGTGYPKISPRFYGDDAFTPEKFDPGECRACRNHLTSISS